MIEFEKPELVIVKFDNNNIITASTCIEVDEKCLKQDSGCGYVW